MKNKPPIIGKVLGLVLIIVGFAKSKSGRWMLRSVVFDVVMYP